MAGRNNPVVTVPVFPVGPASPTPGARHESIRDARRAAREDGTRSILDMERVSTTPATFAVAPLAAATLRRLYGTTEPTREMVERDLAFFEDMDERGQGIYIVLYHDRQPREILFAGYSFD